MLLESQAVVASAQGGPALGGQLRFYLFENQVKDILFAVVAQLVEHVIGNDEVTSSILVNGSENRIGG